MATETVQLPPDPLNPNEPTSATMEVPDAGGPEPSVGATPEPAGPDPRHPEPQPLEPESPTQPVEDDLGPDVEGRVVPLAALRAERRQRQAMAARIQEIEAENQRNREVMARFQERVQVAREQEALRQQQLAAQQQQPQLPDPETDPVGHWRARTAMLEQYVQNVAQQQQQQVEQVRQTQEYGQQVMAVQGMVSQFATQNPDYFDALAFVRERRDADLINLGYSDPQARAQVIANESEMIVRSALANGQNPAANIWQLAHAWGWAPARQQQAPAPQQQAQRQAPAPRQQPQGDPVDRMRRAQRAAQTLSDAALTTVGEMPSLEGLLTLPESEFDRFYAKHPDVVEAFLEGRL